MTAPATIDSLRHALHAGQHAAAARDAERLLAASPDDTDLLEIAAISPPMRCGRATIWRISCCATAAPMKQRRWRATPSRSPPTPRPRTPSSASG
jgi:hypothetical protein